MFTKAAGETFDVGVDWSKRLAQFVPADTIATSNWQVLKGNVAVNNSTSIVNGLPGKSHSATIAKVWWTGGTKGSLIGLRNTIVTVGGRTLVEEGEGEVT